MFEPPTADFDTACTQMHEHDPATCTPENYDADRTANGATIHTTTGTLAEIAHRVGLVQQSLSGTGDVNREAIVSELQGVADALYELVASASEAQTERQRRETEYQETGAITFPSIAG